MDSELRSSPAESAGAKAAFRKPSNDSTNRKYRRRSPLSGSSSSDGSPSRARSLTPIPSWDDNDRRRRDDKRKFDRDHGRSQYGRKGDSYRYSDRPSSRSSHNHHRHEDNIRSEKRGEEDHRNFSKLSPRSKAVSHSDHARRETEHSRSRDSLHNVENYSRDKSDGSRHKSRDRDREASSLEHHKYKDKDSSDRIGSGRRQTSFSIEDGKSGEQDRHKREEDGRDEKREHRKTSMGRSPTYEEPRGQHGDLLSRRDSSRHSLKEDSRRDSKELDDTKYTKEEKEKYLDLETKRRKEQLNRDPGVLVEDRSTLISNDQETSAKKPKLSSLSRGTDQGNDASKRTNPAVEIQYSSSKQEQVGKMSAVQDYVKDSDIDAAKVAAMKAAELVNRNLVGTGYMSTDQKKKLLWGSKKTTTTEESAHRWDASLFTDRERQEKFNKLMSLRLHWYLWPIVGCERRREGGAQGRQPRWKWDPPSREAEGSPVGLGEAVYCWTPSTGWPYSWPRSLKMYLEYFHNDVIILRCNLSYCYTPSRILLIFNSWLYLNLLLWKFRILITSVLLGSFSTFRALAMKRSTLPYVHSVVSISFGFFSGFSVFHVGEKECYSKLEAT